jgi:transcriptional regulator of heat shock response
MALVDEYVESATPVGSSRIAEQYLREVSPATIRNELMGLESDGYARSPHTSAGRIPTNIGYRVFVNALLLREGMRGAGLKTESLKADTEVPATTGRGLRNAELRALDADQRIDEALAFLSRSTGLLSVHWSIRPEVTVHHRGLPQLFAQPEFQDASVLIPLMRLIEDESALARLLLSTLGRSGFVVKIGIEDEDGYLSSYSMVAEIYGDGRPQGALAVFGPTRMDYRRVIPAVLLASQLFGYPRTRMFGR